MSSGDKKEDYPAVPFVIPGSGGKTLADIESPENLGSEQHEHEHSVHGGNVNVPVQSETSQTQQTESESTKPQEGGNAGTEGNVMTKENVGLTSEAKKEVEEKKDDVKKVEEKKKPEEKQEDTRSFFTRIGSMFRRTTGTKPKQEKKEEPKKKMETKPATETTTPTKTEPEAVAKPVEDKSASNVEPKSEAMTKDVKPEIPTANPIKTDVNTNIASETKGSQESGEIGPLKEESKDKTQVKDASTDTNKPNKEPKIVLEGTKPNITESKSKSEVGKQNYIPAFFKRKSQSLQAEVKPIPGHQNPEQKNVAAAKEDANKIQSKETTAGGDTKAKELGHEHKETFLEKVERFFTCGRSANTAVKA